MEPTNKTCPKCNMGTLISRRSKYGVFVSCSFYPDTCEFITRAGENNKILNPVIKMPEREILTLKKDGDRTD